MESNLHSSGKDSKDQETLDTSLANRSVHQLTNPAASEKVVVIGLSKTGTSTLKDMLQTIGYGVCGPRKDLLKKIRRGDFAATNSVLASYDAFEDWPWPLTYQYVFERYGEKSKFILTTRITTEKWLESVKQHGYGKRIFASMKKTYGYYRPYGREIEFSEFYEFHNEGARRFFSEHPNQFLEFCLEKGDGWEKLCAFLGQPTPDKPVPHRNRTYLSKQKFNRRLNRLIEPFYRVICFFSHLKQKPLRRSSLANHF